MRHPDGEKVATRAQDLRADTGKRSDLLTDNTGMLATVSDKETKVKAVATTGHNLEKVTLIGCRGHRIRQPDSGPGKSSKWHSGID